MERNDKGMMLGFGLVLLLVPLVLWEPAVALTTSPPAFTDRKAGDFGMASEILIEKSVPPIRKWSSVVGLALLLILS